jgi:hypothetical protein
LFYSSNTKQSVMKEVHMDGDGVDSVVGVVEVGWWWR